MNIYLQELKFYRRSTIVWVLVFMFGVFAYMSLLPSFQSDVAVFQKLLQGFPLAVRKAAGINLDIFFTTFGFYSYVLTYLWMLGAIQAMSLGIGVLSKEISGKTSDFLLSKPVTRFRVLTSKLMAILTVLLVTNVVFILSSFAAARLFATKPFDVGTFVFIAGTMLFVQLFFLALGYLISVIVPKIKTVLSYSLPIVFSFFIIGLLESVVGSDTARYITPFKYFDINYMLAKNSYDWKFVLIDIVFVFICIVAAYIIYIRKDIQAVA